MRVGIDIRAALHGHTGIGRYASEIARALVSSSDADLTPVLFGMCWKRAPDSPLLQWLESQRVETRLTRLPARCLPWLAKLGAPVDRLCGGLDVFHFTDLVFPPVRQAARVVTLHDVAFAVEDPFHPPHFRTRIAERVRRAVTDADAVIAPSQFTKDEAMRVWGLEANKLHVVPPGSDHVRRWRPESLERSEESFILSVGTLEPRKNYPRLIRAFDRLASRRRDLVLKLVGARGWMGEAIDEALRRSRHRDRIQWHDSVGDEELSALYRSCLFFCYPSLYEGFGIPIVEAMQHGAPTLTSNLGAPSEVAGRGALEVDPLDDDALYDGMNQLAEDAELRARLSRAGRERVKDLTWANAARRTAEVYARVVRS